MPKAAEPPQASGMQTLVKPQSVTVTKVHSDALMGARRARVLMGPGEVAIPTGQRRGEKNLKGHARGEPAYTFQNPASILQEMKDRTH